jgi:hypothetical protein
MQLKAILDRTSCEESLIENVQQLQTLSESHDSWTNIISDTTYGAIHRRIAFVQYFIRHSLHKKIGNLKLGSLNLSPFSLNMQVIGLWTGVMPVHTPDDNAIVRIICSFGDAGSAAIYLSVFPKTGDAELAEILFGKNIDARQTVTDVAAGEQLASGAYINWKRWQQGQVYECLPAIIDGKARL